MQRLVEQGVAAEAVCVMLVASTVLSMNPARFCPGGWNSASLVADVGLHSAIMQEGPVFRTTTETNSDVVHPFHHQIAAFSRRAGR